MDGRSDASLLAAAALVIAVVPALVLSATPVPSRILALDELRTGVGFELAGVFVNESYFHDLSMVDAGITVAFLVHFADGATENVSFVFQTFLCRNANVATIHVDPQVVFSAPCAESSVLVMVR